VNFGHLFGVSLVPFATAWMARTHMAAVPVAIYAAIFVCVDLAYLVFERQVHAQADKTQIPERVRRAAHVRSLATLAIFLCATAVAVFLPWASFVLICCALIPYLTPELAIDLGSGSNLSINLKQSSCKGK